VPPELYGDFVLHLQFLSLAVRFSSYIFSAPATRFSKFICLLVAIFIW